MKNLRRVGGRVAKQNNQRTQPCCCERIKKCILAFQAQKEKVAKKELDKER
jgi:hypothetical protein